MFYLRSMEVIFLFFIRLRISVMLWFIWYYMATLPFSPHQPPHSIFQLVVLPDLASHLPSAQVSTLKATDLTAPSAPTGAPSFAMAAHPGKQKSHKFATAAYLKAQIG